MSTCEKKEKGVGVLRNPWLNRGLAFSEQQRDALGLRGLLPAAVSTRDQQVERWKALIAQQPTPLMKYITLDTARMIDEALYFQLVMENVEEYMPLIYTPTVGEACQKFGHIYRAHRGLYICAEDRGHVRDIVANVPNQKVDIIVVTDGQRILGLGDLGACGMGIPMGLQYSITAIGSVILQTAVNSLGSAAVAAVTAGGKISTFLCCPYDAMGATLATYAGQNIGARKLSRVGKGVRDCLILGAGYAVVALVIIYFFSDVITLLFVDAGETAIIANARTFLLINVAFYFPLSLIYVYRFTIQGLGYSRLAIFAGVSEMIARSLMGFCLVPVFGYLAVCFASPVAWLAADAFLLPAYIHVLKDLKIRLLRRSRMEETQAASAAGQPRA